MNAEDITKGSTLIATLNDENFPFGQAEDLRKELHEMMEKYAKHQRLKGRFKQAGKEKIRRTNQQRDER